MSANANANTVNKYGEQELNERNKVYETELNIDDVEQFCIWS